MQELQPLGADRRGRVGEGQADDSERAAASIIEGQLDRGERLLLGSGECDQLVVALDGRIRPAALLTLAADDDVIGLGFERDYVAIAAEGRLGTVSRDMLEVDPWRVGRRREGRGAFVDHLRRNLAAIANGFAFNEGAEPLALGANGGRPSIRLKRAGCRLTNRTGAKTAAASTGPSCRIHFYKRRELKRTLAFSHVVHIGAWSAPNDLDVRFKLVHLVRQPPDLLSSARRILNRSKESL